MKMDSIKLGLATAIVFAIAWVICSLLVVLMPSSAAQISGHMLHADLNDLSWRISPIGFVVGLVAWSVLAGLIAWAIAATYNRFA